MWLEHLGAVPHAVTEDSAHVALRWIKKLPKEAWKPVDRRSKDCSRIKFTARFFHAASDAWATRVPPELLSLGEEAVERARAVVPGAPWDDFQIDTLVLNRYPAGKGVAKHKDPEQWVPLVLGVTLYEDACNSPVNAMEFENGRDKRIVPTPPVGVRVPRPGVHRRDARSASRAPRAEGQRVLSHVSGVCA